MLSKLLYSNHQFNRFNAFDLESIRTDKMVIRGDIFRKSQYIDSVRRIGYSFGRISSHNQDRENVKFGGVVIFTFNRTNPR